MFLLVDKPKGYTSHDVVDKVKRLYRWEKIGHGWTLDPMATGLLVIAIGKDTKKLGSLLGLDKTYRTTIDFSKHTDTWDMEYRKEYEELLCDTKKQTIMIDGIIKNRPSLIDVQLLLDRMLEEELFPLTPFSAKKIEGKKLYEYARAWTPIFIDSPMKVYNYTIIRYDFPLLELELHVWSGTYIRSLWHWIGRELWLWSATLIQLARTKVGTLCFS